MAKTRHNNLLDTIDDVLTHAKEEGVLHLYTEDQQFSGRTITVKNNKMFHFGTTGYLGLEQDDRLKEAAISAIRKYGTQFPLSKSYISHTKYQELEDVLQQMFETPVIVAKNSTLAHIAVIPTILRDEDAVILDHQVHYSVQNACQLLKPRGIPVEMIRHSRMDMLEERVKKLSQKHDKVYYMIDGVYSMFGDVAPLNDIIALVNKYDCLHVYVDDVHGMSWAGKNGTGYVKSVMPELHSKFILVSTLSKTFGANGASIITDNPEIFRKIKTFGGPLSFSAQLDPASVGAAIASAEIHLSDEIYKMQTELSTRIDYCNKLLRETNLPLVEYNTCPVFFVGVGVPTTGYNLVKRMMDDGFFVNLGAFPAVPIKNTGVRFTISRHNQLDDIKQLVDAFKYHYPLALQDEGKTQNQVRKAFNLPLINEEENKPQERSTTLSYYASINDIDAEEWDNVMGGNGIFDHRGLAILEQIFQDNERVEDNWEFHYIIIRDSNKPVLATFFTSSLWKDDMLSAYQTSLNVEKKRKENPYYLTSRVLGMGSLITEGDHLYLDKSNPKWSASLVQLLDYLPQLQESTKSSMIVLRDLNETDTEVKNLLLSQGYFTASMPESCIIDQLSTFDPDEFYQQLTPNSKKHFKRDVAKYKDKLTIELKNSLSDEEQSAFSNLYNNVVERNYDINSFNYPDSLFRKISGTDNWHFIVIRIKETNKIVAVSANYLNVDNHLTGVFCGMDYDYLNSHKIYKQVLYQTVVLAQKLKSAKVYLGFSAVIEKRKLGASVYPKVAFLQTQDNYKLELLETLAGVK